MRRIGLVLALSLVPWQPDAEAQRTKLVMGFLIKERLTQCR
jgi:hypothetical protein